MNTKDFNDYLPEGVSLTDRAIQEEAIIREWEEKDIFKKVLAKDSPQGEYVFYEGPPTSNGRPGMHHVEARSFKDLIPRYKTMRGFHVVRKAGWDTHGLPVELQVEKQLGLTSKKQIEEYGVAAFNRACKESVWTYKTEWEAMTRRMGYWVDMDNPYVTYHNKYIEGLWGVLKQVDDQGFLYKDFKVLPWCPRCGTALSTHELNQPGAYQDVKDLSVVAKFKMKGFENAYILAWTTTPWTLPGNVALAVGSDITYVEIRVGQDSYLLAKDRLEIIPADYEIIREYKGSECVGLEYEPLFPYLTAAVEKQGGENAGKLAHAFRVYAADFVTTTDGTGVVHIAPMYGADDFDVGTTHNLPKFHTVAEDGKFISECGFLAGRFVKERSDDGKDETVAIDIIKDLASRGLLFHKEKYEHSYPHCWRCDTPLLYYARSSWYIRMSQLRDQMVAGNENINWEPENIREGRFGEWLSGIRDWAISRDRYWGTPIPVWETESGKRVIIGSIQDIKKYTKTSGNRYFIMRHGHAQSNIDGLVDCRKDSTDQLTEQGIRETHEHIKAFISSGERIDMVFCSPLLRTRMTADIVATELGLSPDAILYDDRLIEMQLPNLHGQPWSVYDAPYEDSSLATRLNKYLHTYDDDSESLRDVAVRVGEFLYQIERTYQGKNILIVSHGTPLGEMLAHVDGLDESRYFGGHSSNMTPLLKLRNSEIREIEFVPLPHNEHYELDMHKPFIDTIELELDGEKLTRTPEVMDVWFDSGAMPFAQYHELGQTLDTEMSGKFPAQFISEAIDQTRGWFYTLHAVAALMGKPRAYENVICLGHILDAQGKKMSKSKGNVVSPWSMFARYGADTIRMWMYSVNQPGESKNFDEKTVGDLENKFFRMLDNCVAFYEMYATRIDTTGIDPRASSNVLDLWIMALLDRTKEIVTNSLDQYNAFSASRALREFVPELSQWYVRRSRDRVKDESSTDAKFAVATMKYVYHQFALVMAPFAPFTAEDLYRKMGGQLESVHLEKWPVLSANKQILLEYDGALIDNMESVRSIISSALELRARSGIKVRQPLGSLTITSPLADEYLELIKDEVNVKAVVVGTDLALDTTITDDLRTEGSVREIMRALQQLRKDNNLLPGTPISVVASADIVKFMEPYQAELQDITVTLVSGEIDAGVEIVTDSVSGKIQYGI